MTLNKKDADIINLAIIEMGEPLHSPFAKHLQTFHDADMSRIRVYIGANNNLEFNDVHLVIDVLQVFLSETIESDWGSVYEKVQKKDVMNTLERLIKIYSEKIKKY
jgi:hypothetical protein